MRVPSPKDMWHRWCTAAVKSWYWVPQLVQSYGWRFVTMVFFGEHLLKGFLAGGGNGGFFVLESRIYMQMQIGASERQVLSAVSGSPWSLKPIFGIISDLVVMFKFRRTPWIIISAIIAFICYVMMIIVKASLPEIIICICFFFGRMQCAWTDLMIESSYTEKMKDVPDRASDIITWVWIGIGIGSLFATVVLSPCIENLGVFNSIAIPLALSGLPIIPAALGWMTEVKCTTPSCGFRWGIFKQKRRYFATAIILAIAVLATVACGIAQVSLLGQCIAAIVCSVGVFAGAVVLLPHQLWGPMLFMFLANALSLSTYGFVDNFYLDAANAQQSAAIGYPICVDCPHFDNYFYTTIVGVWDSLFMVLGSWMFNYYMAGWKYRRALWVTQILLTLASLCDIIQFQRWNKDIGIPDWVFMLGKSALQNTTSMLNFMPTTILIAKLCPIGAESTVFALLAGFSNFGQSVSSYVGAYVTNWIGLGNIGSGTYDDFSNAWIACAINACLPVAVLFIMPWLIPDARMTDNLTRLDEEEEAKELPFEEDESMECDAEDDSALFPELSGPAPTPIDAGANSLHDDENQEVKAEEEEVFRI